MKFKQYLNEGRTKMIDFDTAVDLATKNCKKNIKQTYQSSSGLNIYRGLEEVINTGYVNTNKGSPRESAYTSNYTTLLVDNLPSWKKYPKRSRGLVCSTDKSYSEAYGDTFHVIPYDNALIAVAPKEDIFYSFKFMKDSTVRQFNDYLGDAFDIYQIPNNDKDWKIFRKNIIKLSGELIFNKKTRLFDAIFKEDELIMKTLDKLFDPTKNGFKLGINNLKPQREVWIQGESLLINDQFIDDFLQGYEDEI